MCEGTECSGSCSFGDLQWRGGLAIQGYLVDAEEGGWEIWPLHGLDDCAPAGPNPEGAPCEPFNDESCAEGLFCYYWGDVIMGCDGVCRPPGDECEVDTDCDEGDVCYHGYCEWCCPG